MWYDLNLRTLKGLVFEIDPYERCVANKILDGKQSTMLCYVGENTLSHENPKVITEILEAIKKHFGELMINRGNTYTHF